MDQTDRTIDEADDCTIIGDLDAWFAHYTQTADDNEWALVHMLRKEEYERQCAVLEEQAVPEA